MRFRCMFSVISYFLRLHSKENWMEHVSKYRPLTLIIFMEEDIERELKKHGKQIAQHVRLPREGKKETGEPRALTSPSGLFFPPCVLFVWSLTLDRLAMR